LRKYLFLAIALFSSSLLAQENSNEVGLLLGIIHAGNRTATSGTTTANVDIGNGLTFQATYARRLTSGRTRVWLEFPFIATPSTDVSSSLRTIPRNYASIYFTPSLRVAFNGERAVAPWLSLGGGYGRIDASTTLLNGAPNTGQSNRNTGALQFGGGVDLRTPVRIPMPTALRAEVRDFYSRAALLNATPRDDNQHHVVFSGGFVLRF
jgi:hypothetical protein